MQCDFGGINKVLIFPKDSKIYLLSTSPSQFISALITIIIHPTCASLSNLWKKRSLRIGVEIFLVRSCAEEKALFP